MTYPRPLRSIHNIGTECRGEDHAQTAEMWEKGVGPGSAKWLGMPCLCGRMRWGYVEMAVGVVGAWVDSSGSPE